MTNSNPFDLARSPDMRIINRIIKKCCSIAGGVSALGVFTAFCLITNTTGIERKYFDSAIPFVYRLNASTPADYVPAIERGASTWNNVIPSYWEFVRGDSTTANTPQQDGINLLYFDLIGENFPPPTNVIAFSRTYTSTSGGYHAIESDLIWNARDFPPSPTGAPGRQDLQSVVTHEFGHHLGLDHTGLPSGASSGCGPQVPVATMWWSSSSGDTTKRSLHPEDIMGITVLYPSWKLQGTVTLGGTPLNVAPLFFKGTQVSVIGPVENPISTRYNRSGYLLDTIWTNTSGQYSTVVVNQTFNIIFDGFGFERDSVHIQFNPPGPIGQTQVLTQDFVATPTPVATISGRVSNASVPVTARLDFYGEGDPNGLTASLVTQPNGSYSINLPSKEKYRVVASPPAPYVDHVEVQELYLSAGGATLDLSIPKAEALIVDDDAGESYETSYQASLGRLNIPYRTFSIVDSNSTPSIVLAAFEQKPVLLWFTGSDTTNALTQEERIVITSHLDGGGRAIIAGQNIAEFSLPSDTLLHRYLGIQFNGNATGPFIRGLAGDIIGNGVNYLVAGGPGAQTSRDILSIVSGSIGAPTPTLYYVAGSDTSQFAGVRVLGPNSRWGVTYFGVGLEGFSPARQDTFILRSVRYFNQSITDVRVVGGAGVPVEFVLLQNYPNPFNPATQITYGLPEQSRVSLVIYNSIGQEVVRLVDEARPAGYHSVTWNGTNVSGAQVASGVYIYKLEATIANQRSFVKTRKLLFLK